MAENKRCAKAQDAPLVGPRYEIDVNSAEYPDALRELPAPPRMLYVIGDPQ